MKAIPIRWAGAIAIVAAAAWIAAAWIFTAGHEELPGPALGHAKWVSAPPR